MREFGVNSCPRVSAGIKRPHFARFCGQNYSRKNAGFIVRAHYCESAGPKGEQALTGKEFKRRYSEHGQPYLRRQDELEPSSIDCVGCPGGTTRSSPQTCRNHWLCLLRDASRCVERSGRWL